MRFLESVFRIFCLGLFALGAAVPLKAQVSFWTNGGSGNNWTTTDNWDGSVPNGEGAKASFGDDPSGTGTQVVVLDATREVGDLTLEGTEHDYQFNINSGFKFLRFDQSGTAEANLIVSGDGEHIIGSNSQRTTVLLDDDLRIQNNSTAETGLTFGTRNGVHGFWLRSHDLTVTGTSWTIIHSAITGSGAVIKDGSGILQLTDNGNSFTGGVVLNDGTIEIGSTRALGTGTFTINGGAVEAIETDRTIANGYTINDSYAVTGSKNLTFSDDGTLAAGSHEITVADSLTHTFSGALSGTGGIIKEGDGTLTFSGDAKTFSGDIIVNGGTLLLGGDNQIGDTTNLVLAGGTLNVNDFDEDLGTLTLMADSVIDFGDLSEDGAILKFADSSGEAWNPAATLTIVNWEGNFGRGNGIDQLFFGSNGSGLTTAQRSQIVFGDFDFPEFKAHHLPDGEVVPVPEPRATAAALSLALLVGWRERKRIVILTGRLQNWWHANDANRQC